MARACCVKGCERRHEAGGLCNMHYQRLRMTGWLQRTRPRDWTPESDAEILAIKATPFNERPAHKGKSEIQIFAECNDRTARAVYCRRARLKARGKC